MARYGRMENLFPQRFVGRILEPQAALPWGPHLTVRHPVAHCFPSRYSSDPQVGMRKLLKGIISSLDDKTRHEPAVAEPLRTLPQPAGAAISNPVGPEAS